MSDIEVGFLTGGFQILLNPILNSHTNNKEGLFINNRKVMWEIKSVIIDKMFIHIRNHNANETTFPFYSILFFESPIHEIEEVPKQSIPTSKVLQANMAGQPNHPLEGDEGNLYPKLNIE